MIVVCPSCQARSRLEDARARAPGARMRCGACGDAFGVSSARTMAEAGPEGSPRQVSLRRGTGTHAQALRRQRGVRQSVWQRQAALAGAAALVLIGVVAALTAEPVATADDDWAVEVTLPGQAPGSAAGELLLRRVRATPYAAAGGPEGLHVLGEVHNPTAQGAAAVQVRLRLRGATDDVLEDVVTFAAPERTVAQAPSLAPAALAADHPMATLEAGSSAPFVVLLRLPAEGRRLRLELQLTAT